MTYQCLTVRLSFKKLLTLALIFYPLIAVSTGHRLKLPQSAEQGTLIIGQTEPGTEIAYLNRILRVGVDGVFVFGLDRDAPKQVELKLRFPDGKAQLVTLHVAQRKYAIERVNGLPQQTVTPDPDIAARIAREQAAVVSARQRDDAREDFRYGFLRPAQGRISGVYGSQRVDNGVAKSPHYGLDIAVPTGTPIHAPAAGLITLAEPDFVLTGGTVLIDHGYGLSSSFLHMSRLNVKVGERVARGRIVWQ